MKVGTLVRYHGLPFNEVAIVIKKAQAQGTEHGCATRWRVVVAKTGRHIVISQDYLIRID